MDENRKKRLAKEKELKLIEIGFIVGWMKHWKDYWGTTRLDEEPEQYSVFQYYFNYYGENKYNFDLIIHLTNSVYSKLNNEYFEQVFSGPKYKYLEKK